MIYTVLEVECTFAVCTLPNDLGDFGQPLVEMTRNVQYMYTTNIYNYIYKQWNWDKIWCQKQKGLSSARGCTCLHLYK